MPRSLSGTRQIMNEIEREYSELLQAARALIEWEREIGEIGFPEAAIPLTAAGSASVERQAAGLIPEAPRASERLVGIDSGEIGSGEIGSLKMRPATPDAPPSVSGQFPSAAPREESLHARGAHLQIATLEGMRREVESCRACALAEGRTKTVFSRGREDAKLMLIGEGPGEKEDESGLPFVGPAGQLLDRMIEAMGFARDEVYICNIVKCRPPKNRIPHPDEVEACRPFLDAQIDAIAPELILVLGRSAAEALQLIPEDGRWRGRFASYRGRTTLSTFHPSFLLRSPEQKRVAWADLKEALAFMGRPVPR